MVLGPHLISCSILQCLLTGEVGYILFLLYLIVFDFGLDHYGSQPSSYLLFYTLQCLLP